MNLSQKAVLILSAMHYDPNAGWGFNVTEFGSIFWHDELPDPFALCQNRDDISLIYSMFALRLNIWDGHALTAEDQRLWDSVKAQVPDWALFKRLLLTKQQKQARKDAETEVEFFWTCLEEYVRETEAGYRQEGSS